MFCEIKIATDALDEAIRIVAGSVIAPAVGAAGHEYRDQTHYVLTVRRLGSTLSAYTCASKRTSMLSFVDELKVLDTWMERNGKWECIAEGVMQLPKKK